MDKVISTTEAGKILGITRHWARILIATGRIKGFQCGGPHGHYRTTLREVENYKVML